MLLRWLNKLKSEKRSAPKGALFDPKPTFGSTRNSHLPLYCEKPRNVTTTQYGRGVYELLWGGARKRESA